MIELDGLKPKSKDKLCYLVRKAMTDLDEKNQSILFEALNDHTTWSSNGLHTALRERGFVVHKNSIQEHRKGLCSCAR